MTPVGVPSEYFSGFCLHVAEQFVHFRAHSCEVANMNLSAANHLPEIPVCLQRSTELLTVQNRWSMAKATCECIRIGANSHRDRQTSSDSSTDHGVFVLIRNNSRRSYLCHAATGRNRCFVGCILALLIIPSFSFADEENAKMPFIEQVEPSKAGLGTADYLKARSLD